ncbi:ATP-binding protein [Abyssisolibacter fermentans]|uniref:ATP-binding protein n=1 Tax=Abyssisolibacter fermentans TaxID=1766203 RepID=UPI00082CB9D5|nr:ATP-binding protein [Abyssisolibacter fermentans]
MKELSLHILDIAENSVRANAKLIYIYIKEDTKKDLLEITIEDDGKGMDEEVVKIVEDPFYTTRKTRKVGLGIALLKAAAQRCDGCFEIKSVLNEGTKISCSFKHSHIDRAPIGNISDTILALINKSDHIDIMYRHEIDENIFTFDTRKIKEMLDGVSLNNYEVIMWIKDYIEENVNSIQNTLNT